MKPKSSVQLAKEAFLRLYQAGEFVPGSKIPSENDMAQRLNVSRMTWRKAVDLLQRDGLLTSRHGSGTYLLEQPHRITYDLSQLQSMTHMIDVAGLQESKSDIVLKWDTAPEEVQRFFDAPSEETYLIIRQVRYADCGAISASMCYLPKQYSQGITPERAPKSIFSYLEEEHSITITRAMTELFIPNRDDPLLQLIHPREDQGVFGLKQRHFSSRGVPILYSLDYLRSDLFSFTIMRTRT